VSTVDEIVQKTSALPESLQREALHYVDYLIARQTEGREQRDWTLFSAEQLSGQYSQADEIYEQD
jgi:hypothetical protein